MTESDRIPNDAVLLTTTTNSEESVVITGLLAANGIDSYIDTEGTTPVTGIMDGPLPLYKVYVSRQSYSDARNVIGSKSESDNQEWLEYKAKEQKRGNFWGRLLGLTASALFYSLSLLPMKETYNIMKHVLRGVSLCLLVVFLFSYYYGKRFQE